MFTVYRNLTLKDSRDEYWPQNQKNAETNLLPKNMDKHPRQEWKNSWYSVINAWKMGQPFPKREMLQRMAIFFQQFLSSLFENRIYPRIIVMRSYIVDDYGTRRITAIDDAEETTFLTDCEFDPFTQFYYRSHTNPVGIDPILVPKEDLKDWAIQSDGGTEN